MTNTITSNEDRAGLLPVHHDFRVLWTDETEHVKREYGIISPENFVRAPEHIEALIHNEEQEDYFQLSRSFKRNGIINPPVFYDSTEDDSLHYTLNGYKAISWAKNEGIMQILACRVTVKEEDDLLKIAVLLQHSYHGVYASLYKQAEALWPKYYKGPGYRTDLKGEAYEAQFDVPVDDYEGRKLNIYEKIGRHLCLSGNMVKYILKIGKVNSLHFQRIEVSRMAPYAAYLECVAQERGTVPPVPLVKPVIHHSNITQQPHFFEGEGTNAGAFANPAITITGDSSHSHSPVLVSVDNTTDTEGLVLDLLCPYCGKRFQITIIKSEDTWKEKE